MKNIKIIVPAIIVAAFVFFLYTDMSRTKEISKIETQLNELRLESNEVKQSFVANNNALKKLTFEQNMDTVVLANKAFKTVMSNYLDTLATLDYERLYSLYKVLKSKNELLSNIVEDMKTDSTDLKNSNIWAKNAYETYIKNKKNLSAADRSYIQHIFDVTIDSSQADIKDFKYITTIQNTGMLNKHLKKIYLTKISLAKLNSELQHNDIRNEINKVIKYTYEVAEDLRVEREAIMKRLLYIALIILVLAIVIYAKELKDAKELEKAQTELKEFFDALNESAIVSKSDLTGKITYINDKFCEISGYSREELMGKPHSIIRHPSMEASAFKELWDTIQADKIFKGIIKNRKKDGGMYIVDTTVIPIHNKEGEIVEYLSVRHDLTHTIHMVL